MRGLAAISIVVGGALGLSGCAEECARGESCSKECSAGFAGLCVAEGLCECAPIGDGGVGGQGGQGGGGFGGFGGGAGGGAGGGQPPVCRAPEPGEIVINELMIDGEPDESAEFIELVNRTSEALSLKEITLTSNSGMSQKQRLHFLGGCMPAGGAVAIYADTARWIWAPMPTTSVDVDVSAFGFNNTADFDFRLLASDGSALDQAIGARAAFGAGVSANRNPDVDGPVFARHSAVGVGDSSPARCANGGAFVDGCSVAPPRDGGDVDGGVRDMGPPRDRGVDPDDGVIPPDVAPRPDMAVPDMAVPLPCRRPEVGEIVINEVLVDGLAPENVNEFVEMVNATGDALQLDGLELRSNSGMTERRLRVSFTGGCLPPDGAVVVYDEAPWIWRPEPEFPPMTNTLAFGFANSADNRFVLQRKAPEGAMPEAGEVINAFTAPRAMIREDISLNRSPDVIGIDIVLHNTISAENKSPGDCANGRLFTQGCAPQ